MPFIHLRCRSSYSLLTGAIKMKELVALAKQHTMPAIALTDQNNLFGSLEFSQTAAKEGVQPIIGSLVSLVPEDHPEGTPLREERAEQLLLIAKDQQGYQNLLALSSRSYVEPAEGMAPFLRYDDVLAHADGVICLSAGMHGGVGKALLASRKPYAEKLLLKLKEAFGDRLYMELMRHGVTEEKRIEPALIELAMTYNVPLVATNDIYFASEEMYEAHDALMCIAVGRYVSDGERPRLTPEHRFKYPEEMKLLFADIPEALANTEVIAKRCAIISPSRSPILPGFHMEDENGQVLSETEGLRKWARDGLQARLEKFVFTEAMDDAEREAVAQPYRDRLEYELDVIITMKFPGYFLIVSDFITWSKQQGIPVGPGRGSGAGSVVAWSLLITDLDPLKFGLIFERFLNPERVSMPDFDIDFCQERRDEVIRYVQQKYGRDKVAQIITFGKLQARAVLRDVGRVLQMPYGQVDKICKLVPNNPANPCTLPEAIEMEPQLQQAIKEDETVAKLVELSKKLEGLYRHASTHAAGVVIGDRALEELVPLYRDPKSDMPVVQYSMKYAEGAGLVKFDFLGLKTLTVIKQCVDFVAKRGIDIDIDALPEGDPKTYELLSKGQTIGVFQFESAGMQDAIKKLKPDCIDDLIALGALYRPGPMDNIPTYINRKHGREKPDYLDPMLEDVLKETYGVIIYQEQVQKIAQVMAGYTLGAADLLRRAMGKKIKAEMDAQRETFVSGARENGVAEKKSSGIFDLVAKFAGYGFNKSHAAAYAVIAYQTAYLKANYPVEFLAASMNYDLHNTDKLAIFRQEAQSMGIEILPPDVNRSDVYFSVEEHEGALAIRYGLAAIKNVGAAAMEALIEERRAKGAFTSLRNMTGRSDAQHMNRRQLEHLILSGAFDELLDNRRQLYESCDLIISHITQASKDRESNQVSLFGEVDEPLETSELPLKPVEEWEHLEKLNHEQKAIGFYLSSHPMQGYEPMLKSLRVTSSAELEARLPEKYAPVTVAGIVVDKKVKRSARGKFAFLLLSDTTGITDVSIFDEPMLNDPNGLLEKGEMLLIKAEGKSDDNGMRVIAKSISRLEEASENAMPKQMQFEVKSQEELAKIIEMCTQPHRQGTRVTLKVRAGSQHVAHIQLPGAYQLTPASISSLQAA